MKKLKVRNNNNNNNKQLYFAKLQELILHIIVYLNKN